MRGLSRGILAAGLWGLALLAPAAVRAAADEVGVNLNTNLTDQDVSEMRAAGVKRIRKDIKWDVVETSTGVYDWSAYDAIDAKLKSSGILPIWILAWTNVLYTSGTIDTPEERAAFSAYAAAAVARYDRPGVIWEIWNEPNLDQFWPGHNADDYVALVESAVPAIKASAPSALVVGGSATVLTWSQTIDWLDRCFQLGLLGAVDGLSVHLYGSPLDNPLPEAHVIPGVANLRAMFVAHGASPDFPVFSTEYGAQTAEFPGTAQEQLNAQAAVCVRAHLLTQLTGLRSNVWYQWKSGEGTDGYALVNPDETRNPAYTALAVMTGQLAGFTFDRQVPAGADDVYALAFRQGASLKLVAWTTGTAREVSIPAQTPDGVLSGVDMSGGGLTAVAQGGSVRVAVGAAPVYLDVPPPPAAGTAGGPILLTPAGGGVDFGPAAASVEILDDRGRRVYSGTGSWNGRIGGRPAPAGLYIARVVDKDGSVKFKKILVVR